MSVIRLPRVHVLDGVGARLLPFTSRTIDQALFLRLAAMRVTSGDLGGLDRVDPALFWQASRVGTPAPVRVHAERAPRHRGAVRVVDLDGDSDGPGAHPGSRRLQARAWIRRDAAADAPVVLLFHGFAVPSPHFEDWQARRLLARGAHVVRLDLPYHMRRRIPGQLSGEGFFGSDLRHDLAVVRQAVEDAAALAAWARAEVSPHVAAMGVSLGGLVTSLLAATVPLDAALPVIPACELPAIFVEYAPSRARRRLRLYPGAEAPWGDDLGLARPLIDGALAPVVPRNLEPVTPRERIVLVAADHDRIVGGPPVRRLAEAWGVECWEYPYGHITVAVAPGLMARLHAWVVDTARRGSVELVGRPAAAAATV